ncbi:MAG: response regulator transcription factor [Deltaproteobacteria bacterium]|nr:response regulator transcription factor [Deltaproteobacteria bacterium]
MGRRRILVVEDDKAIRRGLVDALAFAGFETCEAGDGRDGLGQALSAGIDLLLLDLVLPGMHGLEVLTRLRAARSTVPVIVLTARGEESDRIDGLERGADDYVVKPFSVKELLARVEAGRRRSAERPVEVAQVAVPGGMVDFHRREVRFDDGSRTDLSEREAQLLHYLATNPGRAVSREELMSRLWGLELRHLDTRTVDMHIVRLRTKLRDDPESPAVLFTVRGKGYKFM